MKDNQKWIEYKPAEHANTSIEQWSTDHWSTFVYLETRAVDHGGVIDNEHMRCNVRLHRELANTANEVSQVDYPTRLAHDKMLSNHDDWSCLEDMVDAGFIRAWQTAPSHIGLGSTGKSKIKIEITDRGWLIAMKLRRHKAMGGNWGNFIVEAPAKKVVYKHYRGDTKMDSYRHMDGVYPGDIFSISLTMDGVARKVEELNYGTHRFLSSLVRIRREIVDPEDKLARRIEELLNRGYW